MRDLPPLNALSVFEAAARHLNFTRAASELNVLQPAVSRQIAALEADLGCKLFLRSKPNLTLTPEGEALAAAVASGMATIRTTVQALRARRGSETLVINTSIGFASCFLMSRLGDFGARHPEVEVELVTRDQNRAYSPSQCDLVIYFGGADLPGIAQKQVFGEELIAVCSPDYMPEGRMLNLAELVAERLLFLSDSAHHDDWSRYLTGTGLAVSPPRRQTSYMSFMVYLQAALNGQGIAIGWQRLLDDLLSAGRLRLACEHKMPTDRGYHCCLLERGRDKAAAQAFMAWITAPPSC